MAILALVGLSVYPRLVWTILWTHRPKDDDAFRPGICLRSLSAHTNSHNLQMHRMDFADCPGVQTNWRVRLRFLWRGL